MDDAKRRVFQTTLDAAATAVGVPLTAAQLDQCLRYTDRLLAYNQHTNLTRITLPAEIAVKHFADSLTVLQACADLKDAATLADVGTGAGFPGLALAIARPDLRVTLIDSLGKRLTFLREVAEDLGIADRVTLVHARAEDAGRDPAHRDRYDLVTARAVAALPTLLEWCGPLARVGGRFVAMKTPGVDAELAPGDIAAAALGLSLDADIALTLPAPTDTGDQAAERRLIVYRKKKPTPARYPRRSAEIKSKPLGGEPPAISGDSRTA